MLFKGIFHSSACAGFRREKQVKGDKKKKVDYKKKQYKGLLL